jgi:GNAT superfamily N-acetyltransferase
MSVIEPPIKQPDLNIRHAAIEDISAIASLAVELARQHHKYDEKRFDLTTFEPLQESHTEYLLGQFRDPKSVFLVAELGGKIVGYAFLRIEPASLLGLSTEGVWLHDIYFEEPARGRGISQLFFDVIIEEAKKLGSDHLMLGVSPQNVAGQKFFTKIGFRPTMHEMRLDFMPEEIQQ